MAMAMPVGTHPATISCPIPHTTSPLCTSVPAFSRLCNWVPSATPICTRFPNYCPFDRPFSARIRASSSSSVDGLLHGPFQEGELSQPRYTGDEPLSRFVSAVVSFQPLSDAIRSLARRVLISSAEKNGIPWRELADQCLASNVYAEKDLIENPTIVYPDYYLRHFHGYKEGNLSWTAAAEAEAATAAVVLRAARSAHSLEEATMVVRGNWLKTLEDHHLKHSGCLEINDILDIGCSFGDSTRWLADRFTSAQVTGLDLSPYFLAVAQHKEKQQAKTGSKREKPIRWLHAKGEATGLPSASFDIISFAYVIHECPVHATRELLQEALRLLRPGGTVALTDNSPKSKALQSLPPVLFTLMKFSEPWMDEYYSMNLEEVLCELGFQNVTSILTNPRHRTVTGTTPFQD